MANNIISTGLNTGNTIFNSNGGILISGDAVKGGYFVTDTVANIPTWSEVAGTLCYCTADSKFYQYNGTAWAEKEFGAAASQSTAGLMSKDDKKKLDGIEDGAEVNVQPDWNVTDEASDAFIKNKPTVVLEGDTRLADPRTPTSHSHGNISNDGALGTASRIVVTDTDKKITTGSINPANLVVTTDSRLSDSRTPTSHTHGSITNDGKLDTASRIVVTDGSKKVTVGTIDPANLVVTSDTRLTDARTPKAHTHTKSDITDFPISLPADGGNADTVDGKHANEFAPVDHGTHVTADTVKSALGTGTGTSKYLREDGTWVTPPNTTYSEATADAPGLMSKTDKANLDTLTEMLVDGETTVDTIREVLEVFNEYPEETTIVNALAGKSKVGHTHEVTTKNAAPHTHTHSVTVSGTTGANSGTAVAAVTGVGANGTATVLTGVKASSTDTFLKDVTEGSGSLEAYDASTSGTKKAANGTRIPFVTSLSKAGYTPAGSVTLTSGTAPSMNFNTGTTTDTPYISALTNSSYTPAGSVILTNGTAPSMGSATTKYLHFSAGTTPKSAATPNHTSTASGSAGGGTASQNTGAATPSFTGSEVTSGAASSSTTSSAGANISTTSNTGDAGSTIIASFSNGVLTINNVENHTHTYYAPVTHTHTMAHTHSVTAKGTVGSHTHTYTKPAAHTHTYDKTTSVSLTDGTAPSLTANTTTSGGIKYVEAQGTFTAGTTPKSSASFSGTATTALVTGGTTKYMKFSAGTTPKSSASFTGTNSTAVVTGGTTHYLSHTHTPTTEGTTDTAVTAVSANGTATALTGVKATGTANVAPSGHTHSYGSSTALTTGNNSGTAVAAVTAISASTN